MLTIQYKWSSGCEGVLQLLHRDGAFLETEWPDPCLEDRLRMTVLKDAEGHLEPGSETVSRGPFSNKE